MKLQGYTIVAPLRSTSTYLVDIEGEVVHQWASPYTPTFGIYLLPDGSLLRAARDPNNPHFNVGGYGGIVQEIAWEWHLWDHLIQDRDPRLENFGKLEEHPELVNINGDLEHRRESDEELARLRALGYIADSPQEYNRQPRSDKQKADWNHANSISYYPRLDQIALSVLRFGEIWFIDHSTSTKQAAGHGDGTGGRGGDLLYRWGNPQTYLGAAFAGQQQLFSQHDARWIPEGFPGAGNLTVFNNGRGRPGGEYSSVDEIQFPRNEHLDTGSDKNKLPRSTERVWSFAGSGAKRFFSGHISGAERLSYGSTLVCVGELGRIFEVTPGGKIVWDYLSPFAGEAQEQLPPWLPPASTVSKGDEDLFGLARAGRIPPDHPGLARLAQAAKK